MVKVIVWVLTYIVVLGSIISIPYECNTSKFDFLLCPCHEVARFTANALFHNESSVPGPANDMISSGNLKLKKCFEGCLTLFSSSVACKPVELLTVSVSPCNSLTQQVCKQTHSAHGSCFVVIQEQNSSTGWQARGLEKSVDNES